MYDMSKMTPFQVIEQMMQLGMIECVDSNTLDDGTIEKIWEVQTENTEKLLTIKTYQA